MSFEWPEYLPGSEGDRRFVNTRIGIAEFLHFYNSLGYSAEILALEYPSLDLSLIHTFLAFYLEHAAEVDSAVGVEKTALEKDRAAAPNHISLANIRSRLPSESRTASA